MSNIKPNFLSYPSLRIPFVLFVLFFASCNNDDGQYDPISDDDQEVTDDNLALLSETFGSNIDFNNLQDYSNQPIPGYITKDNTANNTITNAKATLGRILFYDTQFSSSNTNLDNRFNGRGDNGQQLNLSEDEMEAVVSFLPTLARDNIYTDLKWSNPFQ